ncbi:MAG: Fe-S cluster assembly protein SufD [Alphaproteobacteria bacterium]|nr:Fe-S cluster assembly protein SufD [Alphaproteobacteria bacterium]
MDRGGKWIAQARKSALARLTASGLPHRRDEYWKFTRPDELCKPDATPAALLLTDEKPVFCDVDRLRLVFVDGVLDTDISDPMAMENIEIEPLTSAARADLHWARDLYGVLEANGQTPVPRPLAALNTAMAEQGVLIRVTGKVPRPLCLHYLRQSETADAVVHHVVRVETGGELTLLENGPAAARINKVLEVDVADGATFNHIRTQGRDHERRAVAHLFARLGAESRFKSFSLTVNGALTRNECVIEMTGDDAHATISGACVGDGSTGAFHQDDTVFITHDALRCESRQVFKKVLRNGATGVFQGKILVKQHAQKTDGYQISQALLLDDDSRFLAKPELEIYADDVICSHGATVGAIDENALFYLTSRGIPRSQAVDMLVLAFLAEALEEIEDDAIRGDLLSRLEGWIERHRS